MPTLSITPDISAETWPGATGCARGNHTCSGISPALVPQPTNASTKTRSRTRGSSPAWRSVAKSQAPPVVRSTNKATTRKAVPTWVMPRLEKASLADTGCSVLVDDQQVRGQRHQLPAEQKAIDAVGEQHQQHRRQENVGGGRQARAAALVVRPRIGRAGHGDWQCHSRQEQHEPGAQTVEPEAHTQAGQHLAERGAV